MSKIYFPLVLTLAALAAASADAHARRPSASAIGPDGASVQSYAEADTAEAKTPQVIEGSSSPVYCSTRSLYGTYLYREEGHWEDQPYRSSGFESFDGRGNIVGLSTDSDTGESYRFTGTYELDGNCHGRVRYSGGFFYDVYGSPDGETLEFISTDFGVVLSGPSRRVSKGLMIQ
jgi:hypothetical protein